MILDPDARWCQECTVLETVEPQYHEATCQECKDSDENKDEIMQDPLFARYWKAVQYKKAGIPVLELISELDDAIAIQSVEVEIEKVQHEQAKAERERGREMEDDD